MDVPAPVLGADGVLVDVRASLLSTGTERSTVQAARASLIGKARARPEQAKQVIDKARRDGVRTTLEAVRTRLDQPSSLGYSSAGVVLGVGERVANLRVGDRVACAGGGNAVHAELNYVPGNLCVPIPAAVSFEAAAFSTLGSIALQGVRQAAPQVGERVAVIGLGLVGQLTCRILRAAGCQVVGIDLVADLVQRARDADVAAFARGQLDPSDLPAEAGDCDAIVITAATSSDDPVELAGALARDRARVVIVGDVGVAPPRSSYYGKELELRFSRSYGPGRYDREYEERGLDYPIGYVRWTERRNLLAFVSLVAGGQVVVDDLITARIPIDEAAGAYEQLMVDDGSPLGLVLTYGPAEPAAADAQVPALARPPRRHAENPAAGVIGAGSFSQRLLIPSLRDAGFALTAVASANGLTANSAVERFGFARATTPDDLLARDDLDVVCVATRHSSHAEYATRALQRGFYVFCEKPPALNDEELARLRAAARGGVVQIGFNRRHAPLAVAMRDHVVRGGHPVELVYRVAAGRLPEDHWLNDPVDGGGRLLGEGCHFVDFACWFVGSLPIAVAAAVPESSAPVALEQRFTIALTFAGGSVATIVYGSEADSGYPKELAEAHSAGRSAVLDDYKRLELRGSGRPRTISDRRQDKGHRAQFHAFRRRLDGEPGTRPDPLDTMAVTLRALATARGE